MAISLLYYARARRPINAQEAARHAPVGAEHRDLSCFYVAVCVGPIGLEGDVRVVDEDGHAAAVAIAVATRRAVEPGREISTPGSSFVSVMTMMMARRPRSSSLVTVLCT